MSASRVTACSTSLLVALCCAGCADSPECPEHELRCDDVCTDLSWDPESCGACATHRR